MDIQKRQQQRNERLKTKKKNKMMIDRDGSRNKEMEGIDRIVVGLGTVIVEKEAGKMNVVARPGKLRALKRGFSMFRVFPKSTIGFDFITVPRGIWRGEDKTRPSPQPTPSVGGYVVWIVGLAHCITALLH
ncbi:hypothetical protein NC653_032685 [Populus alba x Populus x berolinensis]|uniref:Uncharacterized protein n=1 Tax=Populus alba x Populus x berolinensis TaxID=444605 RepID=A0AAD6LRX9_9ROSI|nr:hypothetical protein NC653_032685 [Populus alba x Populus x berolinensis]